jgi:hypothetical protein
LPENLPALKRNNAPANPAKAEDSKTPIHWYFITLIPTVLLACGFSPTE